MRRRILASITAATLAVVLPAAAFVAGQRLADRNHPKGFDLVAETGQRLLDESAHPVKLADLVAAAIQGMLASTGDPYAALLDAQEEQQIQELVQGSVVGIGVWLRAQEDGLRVTSVIAGTPAATAGLHPGDLIVTADGHDLSSAAGLDRGEILRGGVGTTVRLVVVRAGERRTFDVERARIPVPVVTSKMLPKRVGYARLHQFGKGAAAELRSSVEALLDQGAVGIVLDLRDNPGGLAREAFDAASAFIRSGLIATIQAPGQDPQAVNVSGNAIARDFPMVVLVNGNSASASEILSGALLDRGRAHLVGSRTFGKGSVLTIQPVESGGPVIQFTTAFFVRPSGQEVEGRGIMPDVPVAASGRGDAQLRRAVALILQAQG